MFRTADYLILVAGLGLRRDGQGVGRRLERVVVEIAINGGTESQRVKFDTELWHALLGRRMFSDVDGRYVDNTGPGPRIRQVPLYAAGRPHRPPAYLPPGLVGTTGQRPGSAVRGDDSRDVEVSLNLLE